MSSPARAFFLSLLFLICAAALAWFSRGTPFAWGLVPFLWVAHRMPENPRVRILGILVGVFGLFHYAGWRWDAWVGLDAIEGSGVEPLASYAMLFLEGGVILILLGLCFLMLPRAASLKVAPSTESTVDVLISARDVPFAGIEVALLAAKQIDYPAAKRRTHLIGRADTTDKAALQELCDALGVQFHETSLEEALGDCRADLLLLLEADQIPARAVLSQSVGAFAQNEALGFLRLARFRLTGAAFSRNLGMHESASPGDGEDFFEAEQCGMDFWQSAPLSRSGALIRRSALESVGGWKPRASALETSITLHAAGFVSHFFDSPLIADGTTHTVRSHVQTVRRRHREAFRAMWRQRPVWKWRLQLWQRVVYDLEVTRWVRPLARVASFVIPVVLCTTTWRIYPEVAKDLLLVTLPTVILGQLLVDLLFGRLRWSVVSEMFATLDAFIAVGFGKRPLGVWFWLALVGTLGTAGYSTWFLMTVDSEPVLKWIGMIWSYYHGLLLLGAIAVVQEKRQRRAFPRIPIDWPATLNVAKSEVNGRTLDISASGIRLDIPWNAAGQLAKGIRAELSIFQNGEDAAPVVVAGRLSAVETSPETIQVGLEFEHRSIGEAMDQIGLTYGNGLLWEKLRNRRHGERPGLLTAGLLLIGYAAIGMKRAFGGREARD